MGYLTSILVFLSIMLAIRGKTWDEKETGLRKITKIGKATIVIALLVLGVALFQVFRTEQDLETEKNQLDQALKNTRLTLTELSQAKNELTETRKELADARYEADTRYAQTKEERDQIRAIALNEVSQNSIDFLNLLYDAARKGNKEIANKAVELKIYDYESKLKFLKSYVGKGFFSGIVSISWEENYLSNPLYKNYKIPYRVHLASRSRELRDNFERITDLYGRYLTPNDYKILRNLISDPYLGILTKFDRETHDPLKKIDLTSILVHPFNRSKYRGFVMSLEDAINRKTQENLTKALNRSLYTARFTPN